MKKFISIVVGGEEQYISASDITTVDVETAILTVIYFANGTKASLVTVGAVAATATAEWNRVRRNLAQSSWTNVLEAYNLDGAYTSITSITMAAI